MTPLKICLATSEVVPFAKTGGLADVSAALASHLHESGHDVRVFMPLYKRVEEGGWDFRQAERMQSIEVRFGDRSYEFGVYTAQLPRTDLRVSFLHCPQLYQRDSLYTGDPDEHLRFALLSRGAIECCQRMGWAPDVFHCNDWHTALIPLYLRTLYAWDALFAASRTVLTIHNIGYQGVFPASTLDELGLGESRGLLYQEDLRDGVVNLLKTGLLYADALTTVSRTYAQEIQTEELGMGLADILRARSDSLVGIVNGVDYREWSPEHDVHVPVNYSFATIEDKERSKRALLDELRLPYDRQAPVLGIVSRMTAQKGFELFARPLPALLAEHDLRLCVLGSGEARYEDFFRWLAREFPTKVGYDSAFNDRLAHLIEAGSDIFLMPSRYEPCGLNQMYSMKYGTIPVVRRTGGLADTVEPWDPATGTGTGFVFDAFEPDAFRRAVEQALVAWWKRDGWRELMGNAMARDYSWASQGAHYVELYRSLAERG